MPETKTKILVCNAGSSSLKFSLFDAEDEWLLADGGVDWLTKPARLVFRAANQPELREELKLEKHADAVARILDNLQAGSSLSLTKEKKQTTIQPYRGKAGVARKSSIAREQYNDNTYY